MEQALYSAVRSLKELAGMSAKIADRFGKTSPDLEARQRDKVRQLEQEAEAILGLVSGAAARDSGRAIRTGFGTVAR